MTANKAWTVLISSVICPYYANWIGPGTTGEQQSPWFFANFSQQSSRTCPDTDPLLNNHAPPCALTSICSGCMFCSAQSSYIRQWVSEAVFLKQSKVIRKAHAGVSYTGEAREVSSSCGLCRHIGIGCIPSQQTNRVFDLHLDRSARAGTPAQYRRSSAPCLHQNTKNTT